MPLKASLVSTCFDVLPKSGSETLLLCAIFLPAPPLFSATSVIDWIEADGINDDMAITDWLFTNFAAAGAAWLSLSLTDPCGSGGSGADGVPIMRDIDLSSEVKIFPTSFAGARFVPYPPYKKISKENGLWEMEHRAWEPQERIWNILNGMVQPAGECVSSPLAKKTIVSRPPIQGHGPRLSAPSKMLGNTWRS